MIARILLCAGTALTLAACNTNSSVGADREAEHFAAEPAAPQAGASDALSNVATSALQPATMSEADIAAIRAHCRFLMTEVAYPSFAYGEPGGPGTIKLNGTLITMPSRGEGVWSEGGLTVTLAPIPGEEGDAGLPAARMIVALPGAKDELGYDGYRVCA